MENERRHVVMWRELSHKPYWLVYTNDKSIQRKLKRGKKRKATLFNREINGNDISLALQKSQKCDSGLQEAYIRTQLSRSDI